MAREAGREVAPTDPGDGVLHLSDRPQQAARQHGAGGEHYGQRRAPGQRELRAGAGKGRALGREIRHDEECRAVPAANARDEQLVAALRRRLHESRAPHSSDQRASSSSPIGSAASTRCLWRPPRSTRRAPPRAADRLPRAASAPSRARRPARAALRCARGARRSRRKRRSGWRPARRAGDPRDVSRSGAWAEPSVAPSWDAWRRRGSAPPAGAGVRRRADGPPAPAREALRRILAEAPLEGAIVNQEGQAAREQRRADEGRGEAARQRPVLWSLGPPPRVPPPPARGTNGAFSASGRRALRAPPRSGVPARGAARSARSVVLRVPRSKEEIQARVTPCVRRAQADLRPGAQAMRNSPTAPQRASVLAGPVPGARADAPRAGPPRTARARAQLPRPAATGGRASHLPRPARSRDTPAPRGCADARGDRAPPARRAPSETGRSRPLSPPAPAPRWSRRIARPTPRGDRPSQPARGRPRERRPPAARAPGSRRG